MGFKQPHFRGCFKWLKRYLIPVCLLFGGGKTQPLLAVCLRKVILSFIKGITEKNPSELLAGIPRTHEEAGAYKIVQIQQVWNAENLPMTDLTLERDDGIDTNLLVVGTDS